MQFSRLLDREVLDIFTAQERSQEKLDIFIALKRPEKLRKVDCQAQKISEQQEEIRALRAELRRYEEAESNNIRDEIFDENDNIM